MDIEDIFFDTFDFTTTDVVIGEGTIGKVILVTRSEDDKPFAAKIISNVITGKEQNQFMRESLNMYRLRHPSIAKFYGINFHSFDDFDSLEPTILIEYFENGSFKDVLDKKRKNFVDWDSTKKLICLLGISDAMRYLHQKGILHRDLKPENILLDNKDYPYISDFSLSRCFSEILTKSLRLSMTKNKMTSLYTAPELFEDDEHPGPGIDVYSFSMIAYEIIFNKYPYSEKGKNVSNEKITGYIINGKKPTIEDGIITEPMKNLLCRCWSSNPSERPDFGEIFDELEKSVTDKIPYFEEEIDYDEVQEYIDMLKNNREEEKETNVDDFFTISETEINGFSSKNTLNKKTRKCPLTNDSNKDLKVTATSLRRKLFNSANKSSEAKPMKVNEAVPKKVVELSDSALLTTTEVSKNNLLETTRTNSLKDDSESDLLETTRTNSLKDNTNNDFKVTTTSLRRKLFNSANKSSEAKPMKVNETVPKKVVELSDSTLLTTTEVSKNNLLETTRTNSLKDDPESDLLETTSSNSKSDLLETTRKCPLKDDTNNDFKVTSTNLRKRLFQAANKVGAKRKEPKIELLSDKDEDEEPKQSEKNSMTNTKRNELLQHEIKQTIKIEDIDISSYSGMLNEIADNCKDIENLWIKSIQGNLLHLACKLGNIELFLFINSIAKFDIHSRTIYNLFGL